MVTPLQVHRVVTSLVNHSGVQRFELLVTSYLIQEVNMEMELSRSILLCVWWVMLIWFLLSPDTTLYYTENNKLGYMFRLCEGHHQASTMCWSFQYINDISFMYWLQLQYIVEAWLAIYRLCTDSFNTLYRPDDDPHRVETCSLVDCFQYNTKLCLTVIKTVLILNEYRLLFARPPCCGVPSPIRWEGIVGWGKGLGVGGDVGWRRAAFM
jgi:hypothetical protein